MPRVVFGPEARREAHEAREWYESKAKGLGLEFARAVDAICSSIKRFPEAYPVVTRQYRQAVLRRFPYSIIYEIMDSEIIVLRCFHHRRDPAVWQGSQRNAD